MSRRFNWGELTPANLLPWHASCQIVSVPGVHVLPGEEHTECPPLPSSGSRQRGDFRVLVADDYVDAAESICALLTSFGCTTAIAYDGAAALALVDLFQPHVLILDLDMPILGGLEVARRIRSQPTRPHPLMLIAMTGQIAGTRQQALDAGFDEFVRKPVDTAWLEQLLDRWRSDASGAR
jgi:CheY-like chemotaxis protein